MQDISEFMLLFRMKPSNQQPSKEALEAMHKQWSAFIGTLASQA